MRALVDPLVLRAVLEHSLAAERRVDVEGASRRRLARTMRQRERPGDDSIATRRSAHLPPVDSKSEEGQLQGSGCVNRERVGVFCDGFCVAICRVRWLAEGVLVYYVARNLSVAVGLLTLSRERERRWSDFFVRL